MLDSSGHVVLADFGLAKEVTTEDGTTDTFCGTPDYIAPEITKYWRYNYMVDFWSLGVMMYEMVTGKAPFDGDDEDQLFRSIRDQDIRYPRWVGADTNAILRGFLERSVDKRLGNKGQEEIQQHKFFHGLYGGKAGSWDAVKGRTLKPPIIPSKKSATANFDSEFTDKKVEITPTAAEEIKRLDQTQFADFDFARG